ncbi:MAG: transporter substrate-binding domain-containing protein, partial [Owenweeksia sp.]
MKYFTCLFLALSTVMSAQDSTLIIGIKEAPPFVNYTAAGKPAGLSVDFWELVDNDIPASIVYRKFNTIPELTTALQKGEIDLSINPLTVTDQRMAYLDFSQPFFISGTTMVRRQENRWWSIVRNVFSWQFFSAIAALFLVIWIFGFVMWMLERRNNPEQFHKGWRGVGDGFWWSAVTMTTVGYGDKAPVTRGGRILGVVWMFAAILMISGLTAGIASSLTVSSLEGGIESVEDLEKFKVGTIDGSSSADYLEIFEIDSRKFNSVTEGLQAVKDKKLDVFVYDRPLLQYYLDEGDFSELKMDKDLKTDYYS